MIGRGDEVRSRKATQRTLSRLVACYNDVIYPAKEDMFYTAFVCLFVCLSINRITQTVVEF